VWCTGTSRRSRAEEGPARTAAPHARALRAALHAVSDAAGSIDALLDEAAALAPIADVTDEYGAVHRVWRMSNSARVEQLMANRKLLIADGHHRYETALAFRNENPGLPGADRVMMTFVNMHSPGLKILATHRLVSGLEAMSHGPVSAAAAAGFQVEEIGSLDGLKRAWEDGEGRSIIGAAIGSRLFLLEDRQARGELDVRVLHQRLLGEVLGIGEEAVRDEKHLRYMRGLDARSKRCARGRRRSRSC